MKKHTPVLLKELIRYLNPKTSQDYIDATLGLGGHAREILKRSGHRGRLLGIEWDEEVFEEAQKNLRKYSHRSTLVCENFAHLATISKEAGFPEVSGIIFDLGLNSAQLENPCYGLSFMVDGPLDMRLSPNETTLTAKKIINQYSFTKLSNILYQYGDVRASRRFARQLIQYRQKKPLETTAQLVGAIGTKNPKVLAPIFQALRIEVNQELKNLSSVLAQSIPLLGLGGRLIVISYHSGEDRIVKNFFRDHQDQIKILTKKPVRPSWEEICINPRSRSAKMRVGEKV